jgi:hypothetical protein
MLTCNSSEPLAIQMFLSLDSDSFIIFEVLCLDVLPQLIVNLHAIEQLPSGSSKPSAPQDGLRELQREQGDEAEAR